MEVSPLPEPVATVFALLLGLAVGSFLNVVIYRVPKGLSIVSPPSACPNCGHDIRPRDNIPVVSWLLLRGKCRDCTTPISPRYPLIEALTGIAFAAATWLITASFTSWAIAWSALACTVVAVAITLAGMAVDKRSQS